MGTNLLTGTTSDNEEKTAGRNLLSPAPAAAPKQETAQETYERVKSNLPVGSWYDNVLEPLQVMGAGVVGAVGGGYRGLAELATGASLDDAVGSMQGFQQDMAEWGAPETQTGMEATDETMENMSVMTEILRMPAAAIGYLGSGLDDDVANKIIKEGVGATMGDATMDATGSPLAATAMHTLPEAAMSVAGLKMMPKGSAAATSGIKQTPLRNTGRALTHPRQALQKRDFNMTEEAAARQFALENKIPDERAAGYYIDDAGNVAQDTRASAMIDEAERQGFRRPQLAGIQQASRADKEAMKQMSDIKRNMQRRADFESRPSDIAGDVVKTQLDDIRALNRAAGDELDGVAKSLKGQRVDFSQPLQKLQRDLNKLGVKLDDAGNVDFTEAAFRGIPQAEAVVRNLVERMKLGARQGDMGYSPDAFDMHTLKRWIDFHVDYGKQQGGIHGQLEHVIKGFRKSVDDTLDTRFDDYNMANTQYADTISSIKNLEEIARTMEFEGGYAASNIGQLMRRMLSNQVSRNRVAKAVDEVHRVHTKYGGTSKHDPRTLMMFADELDNVFGTSAPNSFAAQVTMGTKHGIEQFAGGRGSRGLWEGAIDPMIKGVQGINEGNAFRVIDNFLDYNTPTRP